MGERGSKVRLERLVTTGGRRFALGACVRTRYVPPDTPVELVHDMEAGQQK
jgi:hypothetical protein